MLGKTNDVYVVTDILHDRLYVDQDHTEAIRVEIEIGSMLKDV
jgi:hypothetical protein